MDPLSHALIGSLAAKSVGAMPRRFWIMTFLGVLPDVDVLFNYFGPWASELQHRGLIHSIPGLIGLALLLSFVLAKWDKGSFSVRLACYALPLFGHLLGDLLTSFGVPLFLPFDSTNYSMDVLGSLGVIPIALMIAGLTWLHQQNKNGFRSTIALWCLLGGYVLFMVSGKAYAASMIPSGSVVLPSLGNPFSWRAVQSDSEGRLYRTYQTNLWTGSRSETVAVPMPDENELVRISRHSPLVEDFLMDNRWPVVRISDTGRHHRVEWGTLIFSTRGLVRGKVAVVISDQGQILSEGKTFSFWDPR